MNRPNSRSEAIALDAADPIAESRNAFDLPDGLIYLDGNSLGPPPRNVFERVDTVLRSEWAGDLVRAWNSHGWIDLSERIAAKIAALIGALPEEVVVADSTSVNIFKLLASGLGLRSGRRVILSEHQNFGTDLYIAQGLARLLGERAELRVVDRSEIEAALDGEVAVLMLTQVDFRSGEKLEMKRWTDRAHRAGALMMWDLAHSAGAFAVDLVGCGVDLAVGCGYKYLNGGPGAPAYAFVAERHHESLETPLSGWMGHASPFNFDPAYAPADGVGRLRVGTPPILSLAALECGVDSVARIGVDQLQKKSLALSEYFVDLVERLCGDHSLELASPRDPERRGSQISLRHPEGYAIVQALIAEGVVGDFRDPDIMRFGFAPAYLRFVDIWDAVSALREVLESRSWDRPEYRSRSRVT